MANKSEYPTATPESVWAALQESERQRKENERFLTEKLVESDRNLTEKLVESDRNLTEKLAESDRNLTEKLAESDRTLTEKQTETDRQLKETNRQLKEISADFDRRMKKQEEIMGSWSNNHGAFAEEYFFNSFENGKQNFFGEKFDRIRKNVKPLDFKIEDEYDILLINGKSVGIIEVKYKAHENNIPKIIKKAETFRANFPNYANHQIYLGLASMAFYPDLERTCIEQGIAVVKQVGDTVVIYDEHLKVY